MNTTNTTNRKVRKSLVGVFLLTGIFMGNAQNIVIPDPNFKSALLTHDPVINLNGDSEISYAEAAAFTGTINVSDSNITVMVGIEYFVQLTGLNCHNNNIIALDVSNNTALEFLHCSSNNLYSLDVSENPALKTLWASNNNLTSINVASNYDLESLSVQNNNLTGSLSVMYNSNLKYLECFNNDLEAIFAYNLSLIQLSAYNNPNLYLLECSNNELTTLNLSGLPALGELAFGNNQITSIDVSNIPTLEILYCSNNNLSSLDVSNNPALEELYCNNNSLTSLNLANGNNTILEFMEAQNNDLTCIQIDNGFTPPTNGDWVKDSDTEYCEALSISDYQTQAVAVYPNPAQNQIFFDSAEDIQSIAIYNLSGSKVKEFNPSGTNAELSVAELPAGMYFAEVQTAKGRQTVKVIKK